ncbi:MAG TPA: IgGFc-binding protein [Minicystis sp.]|nr:IgGFc-binding protein [Minicystis sp.]
MANAARASAALALALAALVAGCFESGLRWERIPPPDAGAPACDQGTERCSGEQVQRCAPGDDGQLGFQVEDDCGARGLVCATGLLRCTVCQPNALLCSGQEAMQCKADGSGAEAIRTCDPSAGQACREGTCVDLCHQALEQKSNVGCEYWAADLDNADIDPVSDAAAQQYAIVVSNPQPDVPVTVHVLEDDGQPGDPPNPVEVASAVIAPLNLQVFKLGPREVDGSPDGQFNAGTHTALTRHAYEVTSDFPVVAYQFNPLDNVNVFSNDASLLKPREALTFSNDGSMQPAYVVAGWPQTIAVTDDPDTNFDPSDPINLRAFLTIVGTRAGTHVRVHPTTKVRGGGPVMATKKGGVLDATLDAFDVLNLETPDFDAFGADFTGTLIEADGPVAVFSGSEASDAPHFTKLSDRQCCADHLEDQLDPLRTMGKSFAIAHTPSRTAAVGAAGGGIHAAPEPDYVRFIATTEDGASVKTTLPPPDDEIHLAKRGDFHEVTATRDFVATSSSPISVEQVMASQDAAGVERGLPGGDPSLLIEPPVEQFRADYVFLTPDKYAFDFVSIVAPPQTTLVLDGQVLDDTLCLVTPTDGLTDQERGTNVPPFVTYTCQLSFPIIDPTKPAPDNIAPGKQNDGVHRLVASEKVGVIVMGFDNYVSYAYAAGTELKDISGTAK